MKTTKKTTKTTRSNPADLYRTVSTFTEWRTAHAVLMGQMEELWKHTLAGCQDVALRPLDSCDANRVLHALEILRSTADRVNVNEK